MQSKYDVYLCFYDRHERAAETDLDESKNESIQDYYFSTVEDACRLAEGIDKAMSYQRSALFWRREAAERHVETCLSRAAANNQQQDRSEYWKEFEVPPQLLVDAAGETHAPEKKRLFVVFGLDDRVAMEVEWDGAGAVIHEYSFSTEQDAREFLRALRYSLGWYECGLFLSREAAEEFVREELVES